MAETSVSICQDAVYDENMKDYILDYNGNLNNIIQRFNPVCIEPVNARYAVFQQPLTDSDLGIPENYGYRMIPKLYGFMDTSAPEAVGVLKLHDSPYLQLRGRGTLIGIVDSGIDYTLPVFMYEDRTSKIVSIWDQTAAGGPVPESMVYGTEYLKAQIDTALQSENPFAVVPQQDETGHGTALAAVAAGRQEIAADFTGVAPDALLSVVKLKQTKQYLRRFFGIRGEVPAFQENDIMMGIQYILDIGRRLQMPTAVLIGLGTNSGSHTGNNYLSTYLDDVAEYTATGVAVATGNEANLRHHCSGRITGEEEYTDVEIHVGSDSAFNAELWALSPDIYTIGLISPTGERVERITPALGRQQTIRFILDRTVVYVYQEIVETLSGDQVIFLRFNTPTQGLWTVRLYGTAVLGQGFNMWLPVGNFISEETYFIRPDPETTLTIPSTTASVITTAAYDHRNNSIYIASGRGFTPDNRIKPDITAPGVNIYCPVSGGRYTQRSGTSIAAAHTVGAIALMLEWGILYDNDPEINSRKIKKYFYLGAGRREGVRYPSREWGFGTLNLENTFNVLAAGRM